jgi:hypothetical protein
MKLWIALWVLVSSFNAFAIDFNKVKELLQSPDGLTAEIHGIDTEHNLYAVALRGKLVGGTDFFDFANLPILGKDADTRAKIQALKRHDIVVLKGDFRDIDSPQRHISVTSLEMKAPYPDICAGLAPYQHITQLPDDLNGLTSIVAKVHAIIDDGATMMVEYKDTNIPVIVSDPAQVKNLFRGDKIKMNFTISEHPKRPVHLALAKGDKAISVVKSILAEHERPFKDFCGTLALYPKSPDIRSDVYAMEVPIGDGYAWTYTLFNEDPAKFAAIRDKAAARWSASTQGRVCGRNYLLNPSITICASGLGNEEDPNQANPQVLLDSADSISFK